MFLSTNSPIFPVSHLEPSDTNISSGSIFIFKGLDDEEKIKSIDGITDIVVEEATELTEDEFTQLNLRLRALVDFPQIYLMFNPISKKNWVYSYFFTGEIPLNAKIIKTTYKDNKFLSADYVPKTNLSKVANSPKV